LFNKRSPTQQQLETLPHYHLTLDLAWDPANVRLSCVNCGSRRQEEEEVAFQGTLDHIEEEFVSLSDVSCVFSPDEFCSRLVSEVIVHSHPADLPSTRGFQSKNRHSQCTPEDLSNLWQIGLETAKKTLNVMTHLAVRSAVLPLARRYRTDRFFRKPHSHGKFYTDTMFARHKSLHGNVCCQIFATKSMFVVAYPMSSKAQVGKALKEFINDFGIPEDLTFDGAKEQMGRNSDFMKIVRKYGISYHVSEPYQPRQNPTEGVIREVRSRWFRVMRQRHVPRRLWDYGFRWVCEIVTRTANSIYSLEGRTPLELISGETPDISEWIDFAFYDWCWYGDNAGLSEVKLGRWLGVSHRVGPAMSFWILTRSGHVVSRTTAQRVTNLEMKTQDNQQMIRQYDQDMQRRLNDHNHLLVDHGLDEPAGMPFVDDPEFADAHDEAIDDARVPEADDNFTPDTYDDAYVNMEVSLPGGPDGEACAGKVTNRLRDANGLPIGLANENPILDTRMYEVEFIDGTAQALTANAIAENMFAQVDEEGHRHVLMKEIVDHRKSPDAVAIQDAMITTKSGTQRRKQTTRGWSLLVEWRDGSSNWIPLKDLKESYPIQVAEYAVANRIAEEPAFAWWVPYVLRKRNRIISKVKAAKTKYWIRTHKFGFKIPKTVEEARQIDAENGNTLWWDAIAQEMKNVRPAFEVWEKSESQIPVGYQRINCHMIFDIKLAENFRRKARFVAGGHTTETPATLTYSSVVSRDSVRLALLIAALNDIDLKSCDIQNAYLTADCREKIYTVAGPEFGSERGTLMLIKKALYGLKSSGAAFRSLLWECLHLMGYVATKADPDVYIWKAVKPSGFQYWEMVLCYVDDILCLSHNVSATMDELKSTFTLKGDKVEPPDTYLGAKLQRKVINGVDCWRSDWLRKASDFLPNVLLRLHLVFVLKWTLVLNCRLSVCSIIKN
jgi:Reverse transcriptase (RNA-dependent DNA polymerase)